MANDYQRIRLFPGSETILPSSEALLSSSLSRSTWPLEPTVWMGRDGSTWLPELSSLDGSTRPPEPTSLRLTWLHSCTEDEAGWSTP